MSGTGSHSGIGVSTSSTRLSTSVRTGRPIYGYGDGYDTDGDVDIRPTFTRPPLNGTRTGFPIGTGYPSGTGYSSGIGYPSGTGYHSGTAYPHGTGYPHGTAYPYGTAYSHGTGTGFWPHPTKNATSLPCYTEFSNVTATITAYRTSTETSTTTDYISAIIYKNSTVTITEAGSIVTLPAITITEAEYTITEPGETETITVTITPMADPDYPFRAGRI
jgi:hypothetical protein